MSMMSPTNNSFELQQYLDDLKDNASGYLTGFINEAGNYFTSLENSLLNFIRTPQDLNASKISLEQESRIYKEELRPKVNDLKRKLNLTENMDILEESSLDLFKKLAEDVSWGRFGWQWTVGMITPTSYTQTPFQKLTNSIEDFFKEFDKISNEIQNIHEANKSNNISAIKGAIQKSKVNIDEIFNSINKKYGKLKEDIKIWRDQKEVLTDEDKLKVIALTNLLENVQEMSVGKRIELMKSISESLKVMSEIRRNSYK